MLTVSVDPNTLIHLYFAAVVVRNWQIINRQYSLQLLMRLCSISKRIPAKKALSLLKAQLLVTLACGLLFLIQSAVDMLSAAAGGLITVIPNALFVLVFFKHKGAQSAPRIVKAFYWGETLKLGLTFLLFMGVFMCLEVRPLPLFSTFILTQSVFWLSPLIIKD